MIEEEEINHETTPDKPRRDRIDSGTTALTKREQIAMWEVEALQHTANSTENRRHRRFGWFQMNLCTTEAFGL